jgi:hypothetical protein
VLAVGDSTGLEIIFKTGKYKSRVSKRPAIQTNEGPPDKYVQISTYIVERPDSTFPVVIEPYKLDLSQFSEKVIDERNFTINNVSDQKLELTLVTAPADFLEVSLPKSIDPGKSVTGKLKLKKSAHDDSFEKSFTFEVKNSGDQGTARFTVPVKRTLQLTSADNPATKTTIGGSHH